MRSIYRELRFLSRDRAAILWLGLAFVITLLAVTAGLYEVQSQRSRLMQLLQADRSDRRIVTEKHNDWGSIAYHSFHLTFDAPSPLAFAALGQRELLPWKHRIRMLALEGQIYEADATNPAFTSIGRFDFAFVASNLLPLFVIFLLYGLRSDERAAGRFELLVATAGNGGHLWMTRATVRLGLLALCILSPLVGAAVGEGSPPHLVIFAGSAVLLHLVFWWIVSNEVSRLTQWSSPVLLTALIGLWLWFAVLSPSAIHTVIERLIPLPNGSEILLTQREAVNDAWDLPKKTTMTAFTERHPQWRGQADINQPFEWKWYYAFQQVGDQVTEPLSQQYDSGRLARNHLTTRLSFLAPPMWLEQTLQSLASTDVGAALSYEKSIRNFHAQLRAFYYQKLFEDQPFTAQALEQRPEYSKAHLH
ncbi:MAG: DUF3526 domain-containing protein [Myxococcales bacterium]|nr:DUF3526 domain-containing protein [Myxococcales bacterium]